MSLFLSDLHLLDYDLTASLGIIHLPLGLLIVELDALESLHLGHQVLPLFFHFPLLHYFLPLDHLLVSHSHTLRVGHHLVHVLHVVFLLIQDVSGTYDYPFLRLLLFQLDISQGHFLLFLPF